MSIEPDFDRTRTENFPKPLALETGIALFAAAVLLVGALFWSDRQPSVDKTDFSVIYIGSRMVYLGMGPKLYDLAEQGKLKNAILKDGSPLIFEHPPFEALLLSPLGALPYPKAYLIWGLVNVAIWLTLPWLLRPYAPVPRDALAYLALWLLFAPLGVTLFQGQSSLLVLLLYTAAYICLRRGRDFRGGLALGLALFKFQFVVPLVLILVLRRKWAFFRGFLTMASALAALSFVAVGWQGILGYLHLLANVVIHPDSTSYGAAVDMATIQGFVHATLGRTFGSSVNFAVLAAVSASLVLWTASHWNRVGGMRDGRGIDGSKDSRAKEGWGYDNRADDLMFAAAIVVSLITGFHMFTHDLSPLLLAMLLVSRQISSCASTSLRFALLGCLAVFWVPPTYFALLSHHRFYLLFPVLFIFAVGSARLANNLGPGPRAFFPFPAEAQRASEI